MTILKTYDENGEEINTSNSPLTTADFQKYIDQYGIERATGYRDAIADMMHSFWDILPVPFSVHKMGTRAQKLLYQKDEFLTAITETLQTNQSGNPSSSIQNYSP